MTSLQRQRGLSLIELMLGILLSSLIIAAVLAIFSSSRTSSLLIDAESKMLDEAQFAMENLNSVIRMAGYSMDPKAGGNSNIATILNNDVILGNEGGENNSDGISIWYEGNDDGTVFDCFGNTVDTLANGTGQPVGNNYRVEDNSLLCNISLHDGTTLISSDRGAIIDGVAKLEILYGLDTDTDGDVNQYRTYDNLSVSDRLLISAVTIELTLEAEISGEFLRKTFTSAVQLRNRAL